MQCVDKRINCERLTESNKYAIYFFIIFFVETYKHNFGNFQVYNIFLLTILTKLHNRYPGFSHQI